MDREQIMNMDSYILLSFINMKLRDQFGSLESLCEDYDVSPLDIEKKLSTIDYVYNEDKNQFIAVDKL